MNDFTNELAEKVKRVTELEARIDDLDTQMVILKVERDELINRGIPAMLDLMGVARLDLADGTTASIETLTNAKILDKDAFFAWLEETGQDQIVKMAEPTVHPQTLKAFARQVDRATLPAGLLEISEFRRAKVGKK